MSKHFVIIMSLFNSKKCICIINKNGLEFKNLSNNKIESVISFDSIISINYNSGHPNICNFSWHKQKNKDQFKQYSWNLHTNDRNCFLSEYYRYLDEWKANFVDSIEVRTSTIRIQENIIRYMDIGLIIETNNTLELIFRSSHLRVIFESEKYQEILENIKKNQMQFLGFVNKVDNSYKIIRKQINFYYLALKNKKKVFLGFDEKCLIELDEENNVLNEIPLKAIKYIVRSDTIKLIFKDTSSLEYTFLQKDLFLQNLLKYNIYSVMPDIKNFVHGIKNCDQDFEHHMLQMISTCEDEWSFYETLRQAVVNLNLKEFTKDNSLTPLICVCKAAEIVFGEYLNIDFKEIIGINEEEKVLINEIKILLAKDDPISKMIVTSLSCDKNYKLNDWERLITLKCEEILLTLKIMMNCQRFYNEFVKPYSRYQKIIKQILQISLSKDPYLSLQSSLLIEKICLNLQDYRSNEIKQRLLIQEDVVFQYFKYFQLPLLSVILHSLSKNILYLKEKNCYLQICGQLKIVQSYVISLQKPNLFANLFFQTPYFLAIVQKLIYQYGDSIDNQITSIFLNIVKNADDLYDSNYKSSFPILKLAKPIQSIKTLCVERSIIILKKLHQIIKAVKVQSIELLSVLVQGNLPGIKLMINLFPLGLFQKMSKKLTHGDCIYKQKIQKKLLEWKQNDWEEFFYGIQNQDFFEPLVIWNEQDRQSLTDKLEKYIDLFIQSREPEITEEQIDIIIAKQFN